MHPIQAWRSLVALLVLLCGSGLQAADAETVLISREALQLPAFDDVADRPFIDLYAGRADYERARADSRYRFEKLTYTSDGLRVVALYYRPAAVARALPTIVFNRGSYLRNGAAPEYLVSFNRLAAAGFVILAPMYRGSEGGEGRDEMGGEDLNDLLRAVALARELSAVDPSSLFLLGESRGGMMVLQAIRDGFPAQAAAVYGAPTDFPGLFEADPAQYEPIADQLWPSWRQSRKAVLSRRSAIAWADRIDVPLLLMHGGNDQSMPVAQSLDLAARLQALNKPYELRVFAYQNHQISGRAAERDEMAIEWFRAHLAAAGASRPHGAVAPAHQSAAVPAEDSERVSSR